MKNQVQIPLPPMNIQQQIVSECEKVDAECEKAKTEILKVRKNIQQNISFNTGVQRTLKEICSMQAGKFVSSELIENQRDEKNQFPCYGGNGLRGYVSTYTHQGTFPIIGRQGALCGNIHLVSGTFHATEHAVVVTPTAEIDVVWLKYLLQALHLNKYSTGTAQPGLSVKKIQDLSCYVPTLDEQNAIVAKIQKFEQQIDAAQKVLDSAFVRKQAILDKYLQ